MAYLLLFILWGGGGGEDGKILMSLFFPYLKLKCETKDSGYGEGDGNQNLTLNLTNFFPKKHLKKALEEGGKFTSCPSSYNMLSLNNV